MHSAVHIEQFCVTFANVKSEVNAIKPTLTKNTLKKVIMSNKYSFRAGMGQVAASRVPDAKSDIMQAIGITSHPAWLKRLRGEVEPRVSEVSAIEAVFAKYGVTKNIWGE